MPRRLKRPPKHGRHNASNQACVHVNGREVYLADEKFCFSPEESVARTRQRQQKLKDKPWKRTAARPPAERYKVESYRVAIRRGCKMAGVEVWTPNQLRHTGATEIRKKYGLEAAQVICGHERADVTQVYAERDRELAERVAREVG